MSASTGSLSIYHCHVLGAVATWMKRSLRGHASPRYVDTKSAQVYAMPELFS